MFLQVYSAVQDNPILVKLVMKYWDKMVRYAEHILKDRQDAEDVVQSTFLTFMEIFDKYRNLSEEQLETAIFLITRRKALDLYRRNKVRRHLNLEEVENFAVQVDEGNSIAHVISKLSEEERSLILLHYDVGLSLKEIAKTMGLSYAVVQKRFNRAKQKIKLYVEADVNDRSK